MIEVKGELWDYDADVYVITTNGAVRKDGAAVMGRGCALEAKSVDPGCEYRLGARIAQSGNHCFNFGHFMKDSRTRELWSFPVKHHWKQKADLDLIQRSAEDIVFALSLMSYPVDTVVIPRPGCGNGGLDWADVRPRIESILDDRFHVITW